MRVGIVVAGGTGERFGREGGKQLAPLVGLPVAAHSLRAMSRATRIDAVLLVCDPERVDEYRRGAIAPDLGSPMLAVVPGGETRRLSVTAGLAATPQDATIIAVHDGARPLVEPGVIDRAIDELEATPGIDGVCVGHPAYDTVKITDGKRVTGTPDRASLWIAQTPQVFRADALRRAYALAEAEGWVGTDDASFVEHAGGVVMMVEGPRWNLKVTVPEDLEVAEALLERRRRGEI
ncbi:MAG: 2-C-methyl-D-erythritol 4-phosphate cytidylyltransferase [Coriobacteriia bacterium]|nr:2-C-methyl-D-erythritol 4-phosphate cytidylyltransferase [Coriobacteriia bacterium]